MKLLIYANRQDVHAEAVAWARSKLGRDTIVIELARYPGHIGSSAAISDDADLKITTQTDAVPAAIDHAGFDVIWNRRVGTFGVIDPGLPDWLDPNDRPAVRKSAAAYVDAIRHSVWDRQVWVNPRRAQLWIDDKIQQLRLARASGLRIPKTLVSNRPDDVRAFVAGVGQAIVKPLRPILWSSSDGSKAMPTARVTLSDLSSDLALRACPMIYQELVDKSFELRVVLFGGDLVAARLDAPDGPGAETDVRLVPPGALQVAEHPLDEAMKAALLGFARSAGVLHGSFDLAVTGKGEHVFFEFNEQGQTLWLEERNPDIRILDRLAEFLADPRPDFAWSRRRGFGYADFLAEAEPRVDAEAAGG